jgi:FkbM family methyltransferase
MNFKSLIIQAIIRFTPNAVKYQLQKLSYGAKLSYSQEGEDMILERFFDEKASGFFVDIGAHHPFRFSNTYVFYKKGWRGINIDATPGSMDAFKSERPEDINIEAGISVNEGTLTYHLFNEPALNTFSEERVKYLLETTPYKLDRKVAVKTYTLAKILDEHLPKGKQIDFLSIDVEGLDFEILQTNNWEKYSPTFILIEDLNGSLANITNTDLYKYLQPLGYEVVAKTHNTLFFKKTN